MKVVLDTNVLLAAFATRGICEAVLSACLSRHEPAVSEHILMELQRGLTVKFKMSETEARQRVQFVRRHFRVIEPSDIAKDACRDSDDLPVLGTAKAAGADSLVTGDKDLLTLKTFENIRILSPREFYDRSR